MNKIKRRYRKLKKLFKLSSNVINEYGFRYFFTIVHWELGKNGLAILEPEFEPPTSQYSETEAYKTWLHEHSVTNELILEIKNELQTYAEKPKIILVVSISEFDKEKLKQTLHSLTEQIYENFEVRLFYPKSDTKPVKEVVDEFSYSLIMKNSKLETNSINEILSTTSCDFVAFLRTGNVLTSDALFRIVQLLNKTPNADIIYCDEEQIYEKNKKTAFFKPDWLPDLFLSFDYISNFYIVKTRLLQKVSGFRNEFDVALHYDFLLRLTEITKNVVHIPTILVSSRFPMKGIPPVIRLERFSKKALSDALKRRNIKGKVFDGLIRKTFRIKYFLDREPKVSIIIPTKDQKILLKRCLTSIKKQTSYKNYEIIIVDNNSVKEETISYLESLPYTVIKHDAPFNFSKINNMAATHASGDYLLFLNDDTAVLKADWLTEMVSIGQQENVGVVGAKLVLASNTVQHAGVILMKTGAAFHPYAGINASEPGYFGFLNLIRNYSAVTGACLLIRKELFDQVGGFDETLDLYYQDVDLCLKVIEHGYKVVYTPYAILLHQGSSTIKEHAFSFFAVENHYQFLKKWPKLKNGDPCYNPNLGWNYRISS